MDLNSEIGLTDAKAVSDSMSRHPDINPEAGHIGHPNVLLKVGSNGVAGKGKVPSDGLAHSLPVKGASQIIDHVIRNGAVVLIAGIDRGNKLVILFHDRLQEILNPIRGDAPQIGIDDSTGTCPQLLHSLKDRAQGSSFPGDPAVDEDDLLLPGHDLLIPGDFASVIGGAAI